MPRKRVLRPTHAEIGILRILWDRGPSTVREVWSALEHGRDVAYTTVLTQLQVMREKGFVAVDDRARSHVYRAKLTEESLQRKASKELIKSIFRGSASRLMLQVLSNETPSHDDLLEIRRLIDDMVRKK